VTVEECLARVSERSPELKADAYKTEAAVNRAKQAARPINPRLSTEVENVGGSGANENLQAAETTVALSQEIELGGKRRYRTAVAESETAYSRAEQAVRLQALLFDTRRAALAVLSAQEKVRLAAEALTLIRETEEVALAREKAGKSTVLETERTRTETAKAEIEWEARQAEQRDALRDLALCWGETEPSFDAVAGTLDAQPTALPPLDTLLTQAALNPDLLAVDAQVRTYAARIDAERSARVPNLELSAGMRRFEESDGIALVAGVSVELPLYTRTLSGVHAAEADAEAARLEAVATRLKYESRIRQLYARMTTLAARNVRLKEAVVPVSERALNLVRQAHKQGKVGYLDVLEARRTLMEARFSLIEIVTEYSGLEIELGRLTSGTSGTH
jgi:cobalt-zinc-cadmium efflux system outer membrane protein